MTTGTPPAEVEVDEALVAALVADQHPRYAGLPVRFFEFGWDNFTYRLGDDYCVRLPRRRAAVDLLANEQRCLPALAVRLPLPVPSPIALGRPGRGFPWIWSIVPWIEGASADLAPPDSGEAPTLAAFLRALHEPASDAAPVNPMRGVSLAAREERMAAVLSAPQGARRRRDARRRTRLGRSAAGGRLVFAAGTCARLGRAVRCDDLRPASRRRPAPRGRGRGLFETRCRRRLGRARKAARDDAVAKTARHGLKNAIVLTSMLSRGGASGEMPGCSNALCAVHCTASRFES